MTTNTFSAISRVSKLHFAIAIFSIAIFFTACFDKHQPIANVSPDWISFSIKFKPGTNEAIRDASIKAMEKMILDSLSVLENGKHENFSPSFAVTRGSFKDSLLYNISAGYRNKWGQPRIASDTGEVRDPVCKCITGCRLCEQLETASFIVPFGPQADSNRNRVRVSSFIEAFTPKE